MGQLKVLVVTDGIRFNFGPLVGPATHGNDVGFFSLMTFVEALRADPGITVDTADRRTPDYSSYGVTVATVPPSLPPLDPTHPSNLQFDFTKVTLDDYDAIFLIGDEGPNGGSPGPSDSRITPAERDALSAFMEGGGGLFAVGDHDGIGSWMCGQLPRIRGMRLWRDSDPGADNTGLIGSFNWPAVAAAPPDPRADTTQAGPDGKFYFDGQSDPTPQPLIFVPPGVAHPLLQGPSGPIAVFPDHMHEGEAVIPADLTQKFSIGGVPHDEYPKLLGTPLSPQVIATGTVAAGKQTVYFGDDPAGTPRYPATAGHATLGTVCVWDGHRVGKGRVVTDSSFHHYMDINLIGDPSGQAAGWPSAALGSNAGLEASALADMQAFYVNLATWLARPSCELVLDKSTFGQDEVAAQSTWSAAYWLQVQGFTNHALGLNSPGDLNHSPTPAPSISVSIDAADNPGLTSAQIATIAGHLPTVDTFGPAPILADDPSLGEDLQAFLYPYTISFPDTGAFGVLGAHQVAVLTLHATLTAGSITARSTAKIELAKGEDPRFEDIDPTNPKAFPSWLSYDLRFFKVTPSQAHQMFSVPNPTDAAGAVGYIQQVLDHLNHPGLITNGDTFETTLEQSEDLSKLEFLPADGAHNPTFNFAVARVRILSSIATTISPVRVFFRLFNAQSTVSNFDEATTYRWGSDGVTPGHKIPLLGVEANQSGQLEWVTIPCFATERVTWDTATHTNTPADMHTQHDDPNAQPITTVAGGEVDTYFGCWLDINQPDRTWLAASPPTSSSQWDGPWPGTQSINSLLVNAPHQCLIAEIRYDDTPIPPGATTATSDKLAQRNIAWIDGPNPGLDPSRVMPHPFEVRASRLSAATVDELLITWGTAPVGTTASIYLPAVSSAEIIALADRMHPAHRLVALDAHTIQCHIGGATLVPLPRGAGRYAGLVSVDLPAGIRRGDLYEVVVHQVADAGVAAGRLRQDGAEPGAVVPRPRPVWREVVGTFELRIPISMKEPLLYPEERLLAWLRWKLTVTPPSLRWYPVLVRYEQLVAGRVQGFGGDPSTIAPSATGDVAGHEPPPPPDHRHRRRHYTGKVTAVRFDRFGDFEGFSLRTEDGHEHSFSAREHHTRDLVGYAWAERVVIRVEVARHDSDEPVSISLLRA